MTRIIAGAAGGRRLATAPGRGTRPTSDRTREGLFATVIAIRGGLAGAAVADLYAGSGAVGLEALSRGASDVILVESDPRAAQVIRKNVASIGLPGARLVTGKVERVLAQGPDGGRPRDFVFADPPYALADLELERMLTELLRGGWLAPSALVAVERATRSGPPGLAGLPDRPLPPLRRGDALVRSRRRRGACAYFPRRERDIACDA